MSMTMAEVATEAAKTIGAHGDTDMVASALMALKYALRKLSAKLNWRFTEDTASQTITAGEGVVTGAKRIIDVVDTVKDVALRYIDPRQWNRLMLGAEPVEFAAYTVIEDATGELKIRTYGVSGTLTVRYFTDLIIPATDAEDVPVPDRFLPLVQAATNYIFLANRDTENPRTGFWKSEYRELLDEAMTDDSRHPDEDIAIIPRDIAGQTWHSEINWP